MSEHDHDHDHAHSHDHDHSHAHSHDHDHAHAHDHNDASAHDHDHAADQDAEADGPSPLNASVAVADAGPARKKLSIEIPAETIAARLSENFDSLQQEAAIPGFRPGRAPMRLLEKRFGKDVRKEVRNQIVGESYTSAVEDHELRVLGEPNIKHLDELELPESGPLSFEIEIEVVPEVVLPELTGMAVTKTKYAVTDEQIDAEMTRYGEMYGSFKGVDEAKLNDYITGNVSVRAADGDDKGQVLHEVSGVQMLVPGESRKGKGVVAGMVIEDLGAKIEGAKPGETVTIETTGPERHENEKLIGRALAIDVSVSKIERMHPLAPKELAESMGMETVDELREQVKASLTSRVEGRQQQEMAQQVAQKLLESVDVELPERVSAHQAGRILQRKATEMMYRGASQQEIEDQLAELRSASEAEAQKELKLLFVLDKVARELGVDVTEEEVNGRIYQIAMQRGERPDHVRDQLVRSGQADQLFVQIREEKAVAKIVQSATITEVEPTDEPDPAKKSGKKSGATGGGKKKADKADKAEPDAEPDADDAADAESKPKKKTTKKSASKKKDD